MTNWVRIQTLDGSIRDGFITATFDARLKESILLVNAIEMSSTMLESGSFTFATHDVVVIRTPQGEYVAGFVVRHDANYRLNISDCF